MSVTFLHMRRGAAVSMFAVLLVASTVVSEAQNTATVAISVKDHRFQPTEAHAPANTPVVLRVRNLDPIAMEFESVSLRVEKVVAPNGEGIINLRPLSPGRYNFFDDFHQEAQGTLIVQ